MMLVHVEAVKNIRSVVENNLRLLKAILSKKLLNIVLFLYVKLYFVIIDVFLHPLLLFSM